STEGHAAPMTSVVLGRVVKKEHAQWVLAFLDQREIACAQEVCRSLGEQPEELIRVRGLCQIAPLKFAVAGYQLGIADPVAQYSVDGLNRGRRYWPAGGNSFHHLP